MQSNSAQPKISGQNCENKDGDNVLHPTCLVCEVRACGLCSELNNESLIKLQKITRTREYKAGEQIFCDEEPLQNYATIKNGIVKLTKILPDGRQQTIGLGFPPDFIGRAYKDTNSSFAIALTDVTVCTFPKELFNGFLSSLPKLEHKLFELTLNELDQARELMLMLGQMSALEKVTGLLIGFSKRLHHSNQLQNIESDINRFELQLSRAEISDFLGLTIETVSRQFSLLKQKGLITIENQRQIHILDRPEMEEIAGHSPF